MLHDPEVWAIGEAGHAKSARRANFFLCDLHRALGSVLGILRSVVCFKTTA